MRICGNGFVGAPASRLICASSLIARVGEIAVLERLVGGVGGDGSERRNRQQRGGNAGANDATTSDDLLTPGAQFRPLSDLRQGSCRSRGRGSKRPGLLGVLTSALYKLPARGPVAQGIEQQPSKLKVAGSNPAGVAISKQISNKLMLLAPGLQTRVRRFANSVSVSIRLTLSIADAASRSRSASSI